jgi:metal-sulfur cluster biosynthetic enzyme
MAVSEKQVWQRLKQVLDPELGINLVDLGLIYKVKVTESGKVKIVMTLTSPGCPLVGLFEDLIKEKLKKLPGFDAEKSLDVKLTFDPPWTPDKMSEEVGAELGFT